MDVGRDEAFAKCKPGKTALDRGKEQERVRGEDIMTDAAVSSSTP